MTTVLNALLLLLTACVLHAESITVEIDYSKTNGIVRPIHGVNKGPIAFGALINLSQQYREAGIPHIRLHDCQWPYPDVIDIHAIFRNPDADPTLPANFDFALTDDYLSETIATGAAIIYRLGESIEHAKTKRFVHPPRDPLHWTQICRGIIRHYNEGWANGSKHNIQYWEIWNEPENRPAMWTGSDEQFFALYTTTAKELKREFSHLKFGGPGLGHTGDWKDGALKPSPFLTNFLATCRSTQTPIDFFSWHCYTDEPQELVGRAHALRKLIDHYGYAKAEMHLNEWNYLPNKSWDGISPKATPEQRARFERDMTGPAAAAFVAASLLALQDAPIDVANFFHGETGPFGLFDQHGAPTKIYNVFKAFNQLSGQPRLFSKTSSAKIIALATTSGTLIISSEGAHTIQLTNHRSRGNVHNILTGARQSLLNNSFAATSPGIYLID